MRPRVIERRSLTELPGPGWFTDRPAVRPAPSTAPPGPVNRRDIQAFRGIGVLLVVVGHLWHLPQGAFAALDMFFVLSGFLITGLLLDMSSKFGRIYFLPFYLSRARRLMPTALVVIAATVGSFYWLFSSARAALVQTDGIWAAAFAVNWHFSADGTDYFNTQTDSPLLHYWSLSIEEQVYAVWPLLLLALLILGRRTRRPNLVLAAGLITVTAASFGYSLWHSAAHPEAAYFSTFDRVWEFGAGALLCLVRTRAAALPTWAARLASWLGLALLLGGALFLHDGLAYPAPWALVPVLAIMSMILGGMGSSTRHMRYLANPVLVYIGDISYSLYLWHLPINLGLQAFFDGQPTAYYLWALGLTALFSVASYHLLEHPMRFAPWLMTPPERNRAMARRDERSEQIGRVRQGYMAIAAVVVVGCIFLVMQPSVESKPVEVVPTAVGLPSTDLKAGNLVAAEQARIAAALQQGTFPDFVPALQELSVKKQAEAHARDGCKNVLEADVDRCRFGPSPAQKLALVVGDSFATAWMPGIRAALVPNGWTVQQLTLGLCTPWTLARYDFGGRSTLPPGVCERQHQRVLEYVRGHAPNLIILAQSAQEVEAQTWLKVAGGKAGLARQGLTATLKLLAPARSRVVVLQPPPGLGNLTTCVTRFAGVHSCTRHPQENWYAARAGETAAAKLVGVPYLETVNWFCVAYVCPAFVGSTPVTVDGSHLTVERSKQLAPLLSQALLEGS